jgi:hypothetical protein
MTEPVKSHKTTFFTIALGESASNEIDFESFTLSGLAFDGWEVSTGVYLEVRPYGGSWSVIYEPSGHLMLDGIYPIVGMEIGLSVDLMRSKRCIRVRSGTPSVPVEQTAERIITYTQRSFLAGDSGGGSATWPDAVDNLTVSDTLTVGETIHCDGDITGHNLRATYVEAPDAPDEVHHQYERGSIVCTPVSTRATGSIALVDAAKYATGEITCGPAEVLASCDLIMDDPVVQAEGGSIQLVGAAVQAVGSVTLIDAATQGNAKIYTGTSFVDGREYGVIQLADGDLYIDGRATNHLHPVAKANYVTGFSKTVITCLALASMDADESPKEGVTVTYLGDNYEFNFDVVGDGSPTGNRVDISGATDAASVAVILAAELDAHLPAALTVSRDGAAITVIGSVPGILNNITTSDTVVDAGFTTVDTVGAVRDYFTVEDGDGALKFEFDPVGDGLQSGNTADYILNISACTDAASVGAVIVTAIETIASMDIDCAWDTDRVEMIQLTPGTAANAYVTTENVADAGFTVDNATFQNGANRDYITADDALGGGPYTYEFVGDSGVVQNEGAFPISVYEDGEFLDAEDVAAALKAALEAEVQGVKLLQLSCTQAGDQLTVFSDIPGVQATCAITESVSDVTQFSLTDFTGGAPRDYIDIDDGVTELEFEFNPIDDSEVGLVGDVMLQVSGGLSAAQVASVLSGAIIASDLVITPGTWVPQGSDLVVNGNFAGGETGWTKGSFTIAGGVAHHADAAGVVALTQSTPALAVIGERYKIVFTIANSTEAGWVKFAFGGEDGGLAHDEDGTYTAYVVASTAEGLIITPQDATVCDIDDVSVVACGYLPLTLDTPGEVAGAAISSAVVDEGFGEKDDLNAGLAGIVDGETITINGESYQFDADENISGNDVQVFLAYGDDAATLAAALLYAIISNDTLLVDSGSENATVSLKHLPGGVFEEAWSFDGTAVETLGHSDFSTGAAGIMDGDTLTMIYDAGEAGEAQYPYVFTTNSEYSNGPHVHITIDTAVGGNSSTPGTIATALELLIEAETDSTFVNVHDDDGTLLDLQAGSWLYGEFGNLITFDLSANLVTAEVTATGPSGGVNGIVMKKVGLATIGDYTKIDSNNTGGKAAVFQFTDGNGVSTPAFIEVDISAAVDKEDVAAALAAAIGTEYGASIVATDNEDGTLTLKWTVVSGATNGEGGNVINAMGYYGGTGQFACSAAASVPNWGYGFDLGADGIADGDTITVNGTTYEFDTGDGVNPANTAVSIAQGDAASVVAAALEGVINDDAGLITSIVGAVISIQAAIAGTADDPITLGEGNLFEEIAVSGFTGGVAGIMSGETIGIADGLLPKIYTFVQNATPGADEVSIGDGTAGGELEAAVIGAALLALIEADLEIDGSGTSTLVLTNRNTDLANGGAAGNQEIIHGVAAEGFAVTGMGDDDFANPGSVVGADGIIPNESVTFTAGTVSHENPTYLQILFDPTTESTVTSLYIYGGEFFGFRITCGADNLDWGAPVTDVSAYIAGIVNYQIWPAPEYYLTAWHGDWVDDHEYELGDTVAYDSLFYSALDVANNLGIEPGVDEDWELYWVLEPPYNTGITAVEPDEPDGSIALTGQQLDYNYLSTEEVEDPAFVCSGITNGTTGYRYCVVANFGDNTHTNASAVAEILDGPEALTEDECVHLSWDAVIDATSYTIYKGIVGEGWVYYNIGTTSGLTLTDDGSVEGTLEDPPTSGDTGTISVGALKFIGITTSSDIPTDVEYPNPGEAGIHINDQGGTYFAYNDGGTVVYVQLMAQGN